MRKAKSKAKKKVHFGQLISRKIFLPTFFCLFRMFDKVGRLPKTLVVRYLVNIIFITGARVVVSLAF